MSRLEEKLKELNYEIYYEDKYSIVWSKDYLIYELKIKVTQNKIVQSYIKSMTYLFFIQTHIDNLQKAFDTMQKDLEELKKYE